MPSNGNVERTDGELGPSYWDCARLVKELEDRTGKVCRINIVPPHQVGPDRRWTSWGVQAEIFSAKEGAYGPGARYEYWGKGGAWKTFPAALHAALRVLEERVSAREAQAVAQAAF